MKNRKLGFTEIARGRLGQDVQADFERAQELAAERGLDIKVKVEIIIHAPNAKEPEYGGVTYSHALTQPAFKSIRHETILTNGIIVADASDPPEQLMLDLKNNTAKFKKSEAV